MSLKDPKQYAAIITGKILEYLERSFPNMMSVTELARLTETQHEVVYEFLRDLYSRGLVKYFDNGNSWMRNIINSQEDQTHGKMIVWKLSFIVRLKDFSRFNCSQLIISRCDHGSESTEGRCSGSAYNSHNNGQLL